MGGRLRAGHGGIHRVAISTDDKFVDAILHVGSAVLGVEEFLVVGFVFGEEQLRRAIAIEVALAEFFINGMDNQIAAMERLKRRPGIIIAPGPVIAKPERWEHMDF